MKKSYKVIDQSEMDDFRNILSENGIDSSDFEVSEKEGPTPSGMVFQIVGTAIVKHIPSGKEVEYDAGNGSAWVSEFRKNLLEGIFR